MHNAWPDPFSFRGVLAWGRGDFIEELVEADRGEGVFALTVDGIGESCCGRDLLL